MFSTYKVVFIFNNGFRFYTDPTWLQHDVTRAHIKRKKLVSGKHWIALHETYNAMTIRHTSQILCILHAEVLMSTVDFP